MRSRRTTTSRLAFGPTAKGTWSVFQGFRPLPTITSHARGAIFLGELPNDPLVAETVFRDQDEAKTDKARFNQNAALDGRTRRLFLKGDLDDGGQGLLKTLQDESIAVVAVVFNAVDDQIGSSNTGATVRLLPEDIMGFKPSLRAAVRAGRHVLVTADHGHSPFIDKSLRAGAGNAPRYVAIGNGETSPEVSWRSTSARLVARLSGALLLGARAPTSAIHRSASTAVAASRKWSCPWHGSGERDCTPTSPRGGSAAGLSWRDPRHAQPSYRSSLRCHPTS